MLAKYGVQKAAMLHVTTPTCGGGGGTAAEVEALTEKLKEIYFVDVGSEPAEDAMDWVAGTSSAIRVKTLTGKEIDIDVDFADDTVDKIKERIAEMEGIPPQQQRLIFGGKQLVDSKTALECDLEPGCVLHLVFALKGGG
ncbi:uncharacterized protein LOC133903718 [Phragmites australis]|uniref:uncharacterized protein LOC133903718 n=1 Tax=Phragmites australis TaxID=29695 RepID=UPI002D78E89A|nr:uncharacterized protein LOC133903718 [Phragmites australis]